MAHSGGKRRQARPQAKQAAEAAKREAERHRQWRAKSAAYFSSLSDAERQDLKARLKAIGELTPAELKKIKAKQIAGCQLKPEPINRTIRAALEHKQLS